MVTKMNTPNDLHQAELRAELAAANFADYGAAIAAINNGIRARYLSRLDQFWATGAIGERLHSDLGRGINLACDRAIARLAPVQCAVTASFPISSLTEI